MFTRIANSQKHLHAESHYFHSKLANEPVLFTEHEMTVALDRARKNPEDLPLRSASEEACRQDFEAGQSWGIRTGVYRGAGLATMVWGLVTLVVALLT